MDKLPEIVICLGSSCFSRGNKGIIQEIKSYLDEYNLNEKVNFHGAHCFENCHEGPSIKINGKMYTHLNSIRIHEILEETIGHLKM